MLFLAENLNALTNRYELDWGINRCWPYALPGPLIKRDVTNSFYN